MKGRKGGDVWQPEHEVSWSPRPQLEVEMGAADLLSSSLSFNVGSQPMGRKHLYLVGLSVSVKPLWKHP